MKYIDGDLIQLTLDGHFDIIAHGCNCFCTMGSGIAKQIRATWPRVYELDCLTTKGDRKKLGTIGICGDVEWPFHIVNAYIQYEYGRGKTHVDYDAVKSCMRWIKHFYSGSRIGLPMIGAGLAGGDWKIIENIIEEELKDEDVTIVR